MSFEFDKPSVVIDNGSRMTKAGFDCDNFPVSWFRTVVGRPKGIQGMYGRPGTHYDVLVGDEAVEHITELDLYHPVVNGKVVHWDNMERVWYHILYRELKVAPEDRAVMLVCSPITTTSDKMKCCEVFFETLNIPALCIQSSAQLPLFGSGYTSGISVDMGYDTTDICQVYTGGSIKYAHMTTGYAGTQVCDYIKTALEERDIFMLHRTRRNIDHIIKNSLYVTKDASVPAKYEDYQKLSTIEHNGERIDVSREAFMAAEMFFQPELVLSTKSSANLRTKMEGKQKSLQDTIFESLQRIDIELRPTLLEAVVLCGGLSMIPGMAQRLQIELSKLIEKPVNVVTSEESLTLSWMGAAAFAGLEIARRHTFVTKKQYEDLGEKIVRNRFL